MSQEIHANAPGEFDEIQIVQVGVSADVANAIQVKYAFAGKARHFTITQNPANGMPAYSKYLGTNVKPWGKWNEGKWKDRDYQLGDIDLADLGFQGYKLINTDLDDGATIVGSVLVSFMGNASVKGEAYDGSKAVNPFKAGTQIGFVINQESLLKVGVGTTAVIELTDVDGNKKAYNISTDVLELSLVNTGDATFSIRSDMDFSEAKFYFEGLGIGVGGASAKYAFINLEPEKGNHHCSINPSADLDICDCDNHYQLSSAIDVTWSVKESPADAGDFTLNRETGEVAGLTTAGRYVFTATAADGCTEDVVINYGIPTGKLEETPLINTKDENNYEVMTGEGSGITLLEDINNAGALVTTTTRDFASYTRGASLLEDANIIGVKTKNGDNISDGSKTIRAGFTVSGGSSALNAGLLQYMNIRFYKEGDEVYSAGVDNNAVLQLGAIGKNDTQRVKYSVEVPKGKAFDSMVLCTSGVLNLDIKQLNIYYAFIDETDGETDPLYDAKTVSFDNTGASIDLKNTDAFNVVNIGSTPSEITNLIDNDMETAFTFPIGIGVANGTMIAVNIGRTVSPKQQVVMVTDNGNALLGLSLAEAFTIDLYRNGKKVASNNSSDFSVLGANVLGYVGTKGYIKITSPVEFDEIKFSKGEGLDVFNQFSIYGFALLNDYNGDGTPDKLDPEPCVQELVLDENIDLEKNHDYSNCRMILRRTFNGGKWNSLVLPVSLTEEQFHEAFGSRAQLSEIDCVTTEGNNRIINFKTVKADDDTYLKENTPYIIYIDEAETEKHPADEQYESIEDGVVQGPIYIVNSGVDYQMKNDKNKVIKVTSEKTRELSYLGSYVSKQSLPIDCYIFSNGNLFHTSKVYEMKAYRCWIEYQTDDDTPLAKFSVNNTATGIDCITDNIENADSHIYNISGQKIENTDNLPEGIYIINGKKLIIK